MTTFEDFFIKKKIDLSNFEKDNPVLFEEFKLHYKLMGEKSFDHSKKFWFNKLRKSYALVETNVPLDKKPKVILNQENTAEVVTKTDSNKLPFKSRFAKKASIPTESIDKEVQSENIEQQQIPAGFKPRFKEGATKTNSTDESSQITSAEDTEAKVQPETNSASKPAGFKPRFKAGVTKTSTTEESTQHTSAEDSEANIQQQTSTANKPAGFKPRFKAGVTKNSTTDESTQPTSAEDAEAKFQQETSTTNKPAGFKPRFKAGVTKTSTTEESQQTVSAEDTEVNIQQETNPASKPTGFKPRFKAGVTKNQTSNDE